jgi:hypothetical protein
VGRLHNLLDMLGTIRRLKRAYEENPDPRVRAETAETLDLLEPVFERELDKYLNQLEQEKKAS